MSAFVLPPTRTNLKGFEVLGHLFKWASESTERALQVDCSGLTWFDSNMIAALQGISTTLFEEQSKIIHLVRVPEAQLSMLTAVGFFPKERRKRSDTIVSLRQFPLSAHQDFARYTQDNLANKNLPSMSDAVKGRFFEGIDELFVNAAIHSKSKSGIFACGQLFPRVDRLDFCIVDMGLGIPAVVRTVIPSIRSGYAIQWAMTGRNSTRRLDVPGGLGLKLLQKFIEQNKGRIVIASGLGYWEQSKDRTFWREMAYRFPGTAVTIEVNTADDARYVMEGEIDPAAVF